jgi:hypothetical protein
MEGKRNFSRREMLKALGITMLAGGMTLLHSTRGHTSPIRTEPKLLGQIVAIGSGASYILSRITGEDKPRLRSILIWDFFAIAPSSNPDIMVQVSQKLTEDGFQQEQASPFGVEAFEAIKAVKPLLSVSKVNFIISCLGGEMEGLATPLVAKWSRESGAETVALVTTPFTFEGEAALHRACRALEKTRVDSDRIYVHDQSRFPRTGFSTFKSLITGSQSQFVRLVKHTVFELC